MKKFIAIACILALCLGVLAACGEPVPTEGNDTPIGLQLVYNGTTTDVTTGQWEPLRSQVKTSDVSLGTSKEYEFTGVTLAKLMELAGATDCTKIIVNSTDGYSTEITVEDAKAYDIMITDGYVGGKEIPADAGGPIKLVFPASEHPELNDTYDAWSWQWYVGSVEFVK